MFGLSDKVVEKIQHVFAENARIDKAIVFGSRAKGNYKDGSDIDIAIKGQDQTFDDVLSLLRKVDELELPYEIDLINYHTIKEPDLIDHIDRIGIELYSRWKECKLGDVLEIKYGKDHKEISDGNIPIYGSGGIMRYGDKALYDKKSILIPRKGSLNNIFYKEEPFWTVDTMFWTKINEKKVYPKFLFYQLTKVDYTNLNVGSAVPSLTVPVIEAIDILLPPLSEQTAIASILSSLDDKIDLLHRQNKTLEQLAETLFRQWFVEEAKESWEEKSLTDIADYLNGLALQKFPAKIDFLPVIKIREMKQGISENSDKCSRDIPIQYIIQDGDVLFSWSGSLEVVLWTGGEGALNQHLFKVSSKVYPKWFYYLATKHHLAEFKVIAESKSTTMGHIQREHLKQAMISIPPKELFDQYNERIAPMLDKLIDNHKQIRTLTQTRNTLLPKLMSGEVRVKSELLSNPYKLEKE